MGIEKFGLNDDGALAEFDVSSDIGDLKVSEGVSDRESSAECGKRSFLQVLGKKVVACVKHERSDEQRMHFEKKAKKWGYTRNSSGEWIDKDGKPVPGFRLDEEYSEVADLFEDSVDRYFGGFKKTNQRMNEVYISLKKDRQFCFKDRFYRDIDSFSLLKREDWDNLNSVASRCEDTTSLDLYNELFSNLRAGKDYFLKGLEKNSRRRQMLDQINDAVGEINSDRLSMLNEFIIPPVMKFYSSDMETSSFVDSISNFVKNKPVGRKDWIIGGGLRGIFENDSCEYIGDFFDLYQPISDSNSKDYDNNTEVKNCLLVDYADNYRFKKNTRVAFEKIFRLIDEGDDEVRGIGEDFSTSRRGSFGIESYTIECFSSVSCPPEIDRLVRIHNEIPTSDFANREQNRKDAVVLDRQLIRDRTFIHEEYPGVHEIISAMVDFYDAPYNERENKKRKIEKLADQYHVRDALGDSVFLLGNYDEVPRVPGRGLNTESVIDVLRRMEKNTESVPLIAPITKSEKLNHALQKINPIVNEKTGEVRVSLSDIGDAVTEMNKNLKENSGKVGIFPSMISAVAYLDKMAAYAIRGMSKKEWCEVVFDPAFKEIVKFSEMISSAGKNDEDFEIFYNRMVRTFSESFGADSDIGVLAVRNGYLELHKRIEGNINGLSDIYKRKKETKRFSGALWSGNLAHELIGLYEKYSV